MQQFNKYFRYYFEALGSGFEIELVDERANLENLVKRLETQVKEFELRFSRFRTESEVGYLNRNLNEWVEVSDELGAILVRANGYSNLTNGYFSIGINRNLSEKGYGISKDGVGSKDFILEIEGKRKIKTNSSVDLGGMGKGLVLDLAKNIFGQLNGVCVNAGGDFFVKGSNWNGEAWKVFLENPFDLTEVIGEIVVTDEIFLASSNPKRRQWVNGHHLINPRSGELAEEMAGVYVQANSGELADVVSTALFAMGYVKAKLWLQHNLMVQALLISPEGSVFKTKGFKADLYWKEN